jgi:hypothetical protein
MAEAGTFDGSQCVGLPFGTDDAPGKGKRLAAVDWPEVGRRLTLVG